MKITVATAVQRCYTADESASSQNGKYYYLQANFQNVRFVRPPVLRVRPGSLTVSSGDLAHNSSLSSFKAFFLGSCLAFFSISCSCSRHASISRRCSSSSCFSSTLKPGGTLDTMLTWLCCHAEIIQQRGSFTCSSPAHTTPLRTLSRYSDCATLQACTPECQH